MWEQSQCMFVGWRNYSQLNYFWTLRWWHIISCFRMNWYQHFDLCILLFLCVCMYWGKCFIISEGKMEIPHWQNILHPLDRAAYGQQPGRLTFTRMPSWAAPRSSSGPRFWLTSEQKPWQRSRISFRQWNTYPGNSWYEEKKEDTCMILKIIPTLWPQERQCHMSVLLAPQNATSGNQTLPFLQRCCHSLSHPCTNLPL